MEQNVEERLQTLEAFYQCVSRLIDGGPFDLTDSPKSLVGNLQRLVQEAKS